MPALLPVYESMVVAEMDARQWDHAARGHHDAATYAWIDRAAFLAQCEANERTRERLHALYGHHIGPGGL